MNKFLGNGIRGRLMKKFLLGGLAATTMFAGGAAIAADLPYKSAQPERSNCAAPQWRGAYAGISGGSVYHEPSRLDSDGFLTDNSGWTFKNWGGIVGGQVGYNFVNCNTVWGFEVDGSWASVKNTFVEDPNGSGNSIETNMNAFVTGRLRTGVAFDSLLLYVTGGIAAAQFHTRWESPPDAATFNEWRVGWTAGFGSEWAWSRNWSLKSEVLYANFMDRDVSAVIGGAPYSFRHSDSVWVSRIGVNYRW